MLDYFMRRRKICYGDIKAGKKKKENMVRNQGSISMIYYCFRGSCPWSHKDIYRVYKRTKK